MLGRDEKMHPGFADFQSFGQGFGFASKESIFEVREFWERTRWDFVRVVTQGWFIPLHAGETISELEFSVGQLMNAVQKVVHNWKLSVQWELSSVN